VKAGKVATGVAIGVLLVALIALAGGLWVLLTSPRSPLAPSNRCEATTSTGTTELTPTQAHYASIIVGISVGRGLPEKAATIAIATAYQESKINNIDYGDRDSLGLFQQRPSQGWGTEEQIMDPIYSTNTFYDALLKVKGWQDMEVNDAAQAVQRSGFPEAYRQHETNARRIAAALTGQTQAAFTCLASADTVGDMASLKAFLTSVYGDVIAVTTSDTKITVRTQGQAESWSVAHTLVANYARYGLAEVAVDNLRWKAEPRSPGTWQREQVDHAQHEVVGVRTA
jgi:hypothetical protein